MSFSVGRWHAHKLNLHDFFDGFVKRFLVLRLCESTGFTEHGSSNKRGRGANAAGTHVLETCTQIAKILSLKYIKTVPKTISKIMRFRRYSPRRSQGLQKVSWWTLVSVTRPSKNQPFFHQFWCLSEVISVRSWPIFLANLPPQTHQNLTKRERKAYLINFRYVFRCGANSAD